MGGELIWVGIVDRYILHKQITINHFRNRWADISIRIILRLLNLSMLLKVCTSLINMKKSMKDSEKVWWSTALGLNPQALPLTEALMVVWVDLDLKLMSEVSEGLLVIRRILKSTEVVWLREILVYQSGIQLPTKRGRFKLSLKDLDLSLQPNSNTNNKKRNHQ